jgi:hypothetical protein
VCEAAKQEKEHKKELMKTGCWHCVCARAILRGILKAHENRMLASVKHVSRRKKSSPSIDFDLLSANPLAVSTPRTCSLMLKESGTGMGGSLVLQ